MVNKTDFSWIWKFSGMLLAIFIPVFGFSIGFYSSFKQEVAVIKEDLYYYKKIYEKGLEQYNEDKKRIEKRFDKLDRKETIITKMLSQIQSDVRLIKHDLKIKNGRR